MKIIPVIDILNGVAVHAVEGRRAEYKPLESILCDSIDPVVVACALSVCGFSELYIADLDAIMSKGPNTIILEQIAENSGLELMVDAGVSDLKRAYTLFNSKISKVIIGTETLPNLSFVKEVINCFGAGTIVISLDLKNGKVISKSKELSSMDPLALGLELQNLGVSELIVLDLARVGSGKGVDLALLEKMLRCLKVKILVGGGVRDIADLQQLKKMGIYGVLLATALHSGRISIKQLQKILST